MNRLVPWICLIAATASYQTMAANPFDAYRLGNYSNAFEPLIAKAGTDPVADYYLGRMYLYGYGQLKNTDLALRYFAQSAAQGYLPAVQLMAKYSLVEDNNPQQAVQWYKKAASQGDLNAQLFMGLAYQYGFGVKKNSDSASHYFIDAAKQGNALAQYALGQYFLDSRHAANQKLGLIWLTKAANNGSPQALTALGTMYLNGKGATKDVEKADALLQQAARQNYLPAYLALGEHALAQDDTTGALRWYNSAASLNDPQAYFALAQAYSQGKSAIYNPKEAFSWMMKAAEQDYSPAQKELATLYEQGIGVEANQDLAAKWSEKAEATAQKNTANSGLEQLVLALSNGKTTQLAQTSYQLGGIFNAWHNPAALRNNHYNQAPQMELVARQDIFQPQLTLMQPNEIPITAYYDALLNKSFEIAANEWTYPVYALNAKVRSLERVNSVILAHQDLPAPYLDASYPYIQSEQQTPDLLEQWTQGWQKQVNYASMFNQMYSKAILGDSQSQFEIGQMFQYGIGVKQNDQAAIVFYQNAADQQHLAAEYNLGLLSLERAQNAGEYQSALNWLTDAAFKGNKRAQYVLARLLEQGKMGPDGAQWSAANPSQALGMLYLSAANGFGLAQYELANHLAFEGTEGVAFEAKQQKLALIRELYTDAAHSGVEQALMPLAYYNAMDNDKAQQQIAFNIAQQLANNGNTKAALLLGMLYDRGIGVALDAGKAIYWYQQSGANPVSAFILGTYMVEGKNIALNQDAGKASLEQSAIANFSYANFNLAMISHKNNQPFLPELIKAYELGTNHAGIVLADYYLAQANDPDNLAKAKQIYTGLAQKGDAVAQLKLGYILDKGLGGQPDLVSAQQWYSASAEQGNPLGQYLLAQFYQLGQLGGPNYQLAKEWYEKAGAQLPQALVALGFIYETVDDNYAKALTAYQSAADKGDAQAEYNLALMYEYGKGVGVDYDKAKSLFAAAADKGVSDAMNQLARINFYGIGQEKNDQQALVWYKKSAGLGNADALYTLGLLSETGVSTKIDFNDALKYYQDASQKGNEKATLALARMYHYGLGVNKDQHQAEALYQTLANRQNSYAQYQLGSYYLNGTVGAATPEQGKKWLEQASKNGSMQAAQLLQRMAANQGRASFIEPVVLNHAPVLGEGDAERMYLDALNEWNLGDESMSRMLLHRLVTQYPNFAPAKQTFEQINQMSSDTSYS